ncbi:MAG: hypothetical protein Q7V15_02445, partial [Phenylobacterium sp.]|uniref:hypothetical protein n=1 Tax=Phenylobacterium sp. TaxID=1871053 RepID=UPI0027286005
MSLTATRLDPWRWLGAPILQCMLATLLFSLPIRVFGWGLPEPVFCMVPAFAWAMIRPSMVAPFGVLFMGLFLDIFWGGPMGLWALSLLVAYGAVLAARNMMVGQSRPMMWIWFAAACAVAQTVGFLVTQLDVRATPNLLAMV